MHHFEISVVFMRTQFSAHKELVEGPGNVTDILKPDVSVTLSNGKPLLKDLAAGRYMSDVMVVGWLFNILATC